MAQEHKRKKRGKEPQLKLGFAQPVGSSSSTISSLNQNWEKSTYLHICSEIDFSLQF